MSKVLEVLKIKRTYCDDCTTGAVELGTFRCNSLELPWRGNQQNINCILEGKYRCTKITSPSQGECFSVNDVVGRSHVLGHIGNYTRDIRGCILFGRELKDFDSDGITDVTSSGITFKALMALLPNEFMLEIK